MAAFRITVGLFSVISRLLCQLESWFHVLFLYFQHQGIQLYHLLCTKNIWTTLNFNIVSVEQVVIHHTRSNNTFAFVVHESWSHIHVHNMDNIHLWNTNGIGKTVNAQGHVIHIIIKVTLIKNYAYNAYNVRTLSEHCQNISTVIITI